MKICRNIPSIVLVLALLLSGAASVAADPSNPPAAVPRAADAEARAAAPPTAAAFGESGTAFAFEKNIGTADVPYLADTQHLNRPWRMHIDLVDNDLFVVEEQGARLLKYNAAKAFVWSVGQAGVSYTDNYVLAPRDVAQAPDGHLWVADGSRIVEYDESGAFVRNIPEEEPWRSGQEDGRFEEAAGIAFDGLGHLFVADQNAHRVSIFDWMTGVAPVYKTSLGVTGVSGPAWPNLNGPYLVEAKADGTLYIHERGNNRISICPYTVGTDSWTCSEMVSGYQDIQGMALSPAGDLFVSDPGQGKMYKCAGGAEPCTEFRSDIYADALAVDSDGKVYYSNRYSCTIERLDTDGTYIDLYLGVMDTCYLTDNAHFNRPRVEVDAQGNMLVLEEGGHRLLKFNPHGDLLWSFGQAGRDSWDADRLNWPHGLDTDPQGNIYVADNWRVQILNAAGVYQGMIGTDPNQPNPTFTWVTDVTVDPNNGNIYVVDNRTQRVMVFNKAHTLIGQIGVTNDTGECGENADNQHFCWPGGVDVDAHSNVYVTDWGNNRVQKFNSQRQYQMTFGIQGHGSEQHGELGSPDNVEVDAVGRVYVADMRNGRVEVFDPTGAYLTTIGGPGDGDYRQLSDVSVSRDGTVYVSDMSMSRIRTYTPGVPGWVQSNLNGFGDRYARVVSLEVFNGQIYAAAGDWNGGARIYRSPDGKTWTEVTAPGEGLNADTRVIVDMAVYKGRLYAAAGWSDRPPQIWRTADGVDWSPIVSDGFGEPRNTSVDALYEYNGFLYASVDGANSDVGASIYRSATGNAGSWQAVVTDGNGDPKNRLIDGFITFNNALYCFGKNIGHGAFVWRASADGSTWAQVNQDGFGVDQAEAISAEVYNGALYVGTYNWVDKEERPPAQIWKTTNGTSWTVVTSDGFGDDKNNAIIGLLSAGGKLYAITSNGGGSEVWMTGNGQNWSQINPDGFGSPTTSWVMRDSGNAYFNDRVYFGVSNDVNGVQVWAKTVMWKISLPLLKR